MYEFFTDVSLVMFNLYTECQLELALINFGSFTSKTSSAFNLSNSIGYVMFEYFNSKYFDTNEPSAIKNLETVTSEIVGTH